MHTSLATDRPRDPLPEKPSNHKLVLQAQAEGNIDASPKFSTVNWQVLAKAENYLVALLLPRKLLHGI